jgi:hypothetical protein
MWMTCSLYFFCGKHLKYGGCVLFSNQVGWNLVDGWGISKKQHWTNIYIMNISSTMQDKRNNVDVGDSGKLTAEWKTITPDMNK